MMEEFTKGPWYRANCSARSAATGKFLAHTDNNSVNESERMANAALIAAAPEMYKELKELKVGLELLISKSVVNALYLPALYQQVESINALLAKARGEQ